MGLAHLPSGFSFLGLLGGRELPEWALLHLRYVGVAVFPALFTPLVLWSDATDGDMDPVRIIAAIAAFLVGLRGSVIGAIIAGMGTFYVLMFIL